MQTQNDFQSVIVTGSMAYDEIMDFPGLFKDHFHPEKLHQINISFALSNLQKQLGGTATNIFYNLNLALDFKNTETVLLGAVGKDGKEFIEFFHKNHCSIKGIHVDKNLYTAAGKVITDKKDSQIWGFYYGASREAKKFSLAKYAEKNSLVVISANHPEAFLHFQNQAIKNNFIYLYDPGMSLTWIKDTDLKKGVLNCRYLIGNDYEIAMILKRLNISVIRIIENGINVITTLGEKGVKYDSKVYPVKSSFKFNRVNKVPAYKVKKIIDPTGAGDAWRGGFIAGLIKNLSLVDCLKLGNVMASFAVETYGTVNHKPSQKDINKRLLTL